MFSRSSRKRKGFARTACYVSYTTRRNSRNVTALRSKKLKEVASWESYSENWRNLRVIRVWRRRFMQFGAVSSSSRIDPGGDFSLASPENTEDGNVLQQLGGMRTTLRAEKTKEQQISRSVTALWSENLRRCTQCLSLSDGLSMFSSRTTSKI